MSASAKDVAADMVTIEIDGQEVLAPKGSMIIEAADKIGVSIPRFCYHRKLSIAANCRMCLVDVEKAPKPLPACATPVMDGMKVFTDSRRSKDAQRGVMEFLLINHPLDCPICDQGGECELQDVALQYGRSVSRFTERKRVVADENVGSLVATEMTRCIHCTRCVRFLDEVAGTNELGGMGRGERTQIGTWIGRSIDSEVSGNIIDLCPVGALTNKPFRFQARAWELRARAGIGSHDALGSNLFWHTRRNRILRIVPRDNDDINEAWLSDRDRYSHTGLEADDRATSPLLRDGDEWVATDWDSALQKAAEIMQTAGSDLATLVSPRTSCEEMVQLGAIVDGLGSTNIDHRLRQTDFADDAEQPIVPTFGASLDAVEQADVIVLVGSHLRHEMPLLATRVRKAARGGASVVIINPVDYTFHFPVADKTIASPRGMLKALTAKSSAAAKALKGAERAVVIAGEMIQTSPIGSALRAAVRQLASSNGAALCQIPVGANAVGAHALGMLPQRKAGGDAREAGQTALQMLSKAQKGWLLYNFEPSVDSAVGQSAVDTLKQGPVVYIGAYASDEVRSFADVILPIAEWGEADMSQLNCLGHLQSIAAAVSPQGEARAGWKVLRRLGDQLGLSTTAVDNVQALTLQAAELIERASSVDAPEASAAKKPSGDAPALERVCEVPIYAGDVMLRRSPALQQTSHATGGYCGLSPKDAAAAKVADGDVIQVSVGQHSTQLAVVIDEQLPQGAVRVPTATAGTSCLPNSDEGVEIQKVAQ